MYQLKRLSLAVTIWVGLCSGMANVHAQTIWSDNFDNGCPNDCIANTWNGWTIQDNVGGTTGGAPNNWFVSCAEEGITPPGCGSSCIGDASLHIGANPGAGGDMGASFNETGATNATFRRAVSPTINLSGYSTNTLSFDFIAFGSSACSDDRAQLHLSTDNGATWPVGFQYCLTSVCCGACNGYSQGQWTVYTLALPAAFDNNPNVRVGFHWRNNGNGSGTDPSVAVDDVRITTVVTPAVLTNFTASTGEGRIMLDWQVQQEVNLSRYEVERSDEPRGFKPIGQVAARGGSAPLTYALADRQPLGATAYYRLRMVDRDGKTTVSNIVRVEPGSKDALSMTIDGSGTFQNVLDLKLWAVDAMSASIEVRDLQGRVVKAMPSLNLVSGLNPLRLDLSEDAVGAYLLTVRGLRPPKGYAPQVFTRKVVLVR